MIRKKEWEKSFKNVNGREPNEEDYEKALSLGLVREESSVPNSNKKTVLVLGTVIVSLLIFAIGILLTIFFYPSPKSSQASFASSTSQSSKKERESTDTGSSINYKDSSNLSQEDQEKLEEGYKSIELEKEDWHRQMLRDIITMYAEPKISYSDSQFQETYDSDYKQCTEAIENKVKEILPEHLRAYTEAHYENGGLGLPTFDNIINEARTYYNSTTKNWTYPQDS
ncbi:MAG: hypothetical protein ACTH1Y_04885 [Lactococcus lactis]